MTLPMTLKTMTLALALAALTPFAPPASAQDGAAETKAAKAGSIDHVFTPAPDDHVIGNADAPHTLIVYASNMCPHCKGWFGDEYPTVKSKLIDTGRLRFVFRPAPSEPIQLSMIGFLLAECAPEDDYMALMEEQFAKQPEIIELARNGGLREFYPALAREYGLADEAAFNACLSNADNLGAIHRAGQRSAEGKVRGLPGFILDGKLYNGPHEGADFVKLLGKAKG